MTKSWPAVITKGLTYFQRKRTLAAALYQSQNTVHFYQSVMSLAFWSGKRNFHSVWGPQRELYSLFYSLSYAKKEACFEQFGCDRAFIFHEYLLIHTRCMTQHSVTWAFKLFIKFRAAISLLAELLSSAGALLRMEAGHREKSIVSLNPSGFKILLTCMPIDSIN